MKYAAITSTMLLTACTTTPGTVSDGGALALQGQLVHLDRMAMPAPASALFQLRAFTPDGVEVITTREESLGGRQVPIPFTIAAPARDGGTVVSVRGDTLGECKMAIEPARPFRATGNEPPWIVTIDGDTLTLVTEYGAHTRAVQILDTQQSVAVTRYRAADRQLALMMTASRSICRDSMTGMPHPYSVDLASAQGVLRGCGGDPIELLAKHEWEVTLLDDVVPLSGSRITLRFFPEDGRVAGGASCNLYNAAFELTGENLSFSRAASTMIACPEPLMAQEREFHRVLAGINAFDIDGAGVLELIGSEGRLFARPLPIEDQDWQPVELERSSRAKWESETGFDHS